MLNVQSHAHTHSCCFFFPEEAIWMLLSCCFESLLAGRRVAVGKGWMWDHISAGRPTGGWEASAAGFNPRQHTSRVKAWKIYGACLLSKGDGKQADAWETRHRLTQLCFTAPWGIALVVNSARLALRSCWKNISSILRQLISRRGSKEWWDSYVLSPQISAVKGRSVTRLRDADDSLCSCIFIRNTTDF